jgi:hypothetical protein
METSEQLKKRYLEATTLLYQAGIIDDEGKSTSDL